MSTIQIILLAVGTGMGAFFLSLFAWYALTNEHMRLWFRDHLTGLKLRLKFSRESIDCIVCGGKGEYDADGAFGKIEVECTRCEGSGIAYLYTYRFNWWTARDSEQFHAEQDLVESHLGRSADQIKTRAMARATRDRSEDA